MEPYHWRDLWLITIGLLKLMNLGARAAQQYGPRPKSEPIEVTIHSGIIRGERIYVNAEEFTAFKGIPYAAPPVGSLQFQVHSAVARKWGGGL